MVDCLIQCRLIEADSLQGPYNLNMNINVLNIFLFVIITT